MTSDDTTKEVRRAALAMMRTGMATIAEVARLAGVSRQLAHYWADAAEIDPAKSRAAWLARQWEARVRPR